MSSNRRRSAAAASRRNSSTAGGASNSNSNSIMMSEEQITDLVSKLQQLLPQIPSPSHSHKQVSAAKVLQETCNYIRSLHREVDGLSDTLSQLLESTDHDTDQAAIVRSLLM